MNHPVFNVLFLCNANSARSILAEAQLNAMGHGQFKGFSAGSRPAGQVDPMVLDFLARSELPADGLRSKSWDEFAAPGAPAIDYVITLCDETAGETCPVWPGHPVSAHWGVPDPLAPDLSHDKKLLALRDVTATLQKRIELFIALPVQTLDHMSLRANLDEIGQTV